MGLDQHSKAVLHFMGENESMPAHIFKEVMDRGTPVNAPMKSGGRNFLIHMLASQEKNHDQNRIIQITKEALKKGLDLSSVDVHGGSFLQWAAYHNLTTVLRWLCNQPEVNVRQCNDFGRTPLFVAAMWGQGMAVRIMFSMGLSLRGEALRWDDDWEKISINDVMKEPCVAPPFVEAIERSDSRREVGAEIDAYNEGFPTHGNGGLKSLQHLCREAVRKALATDGFNINPKIEKLEIPLSVKLGLVNMSY